MQGHAVSLGGAAAHAARKVQRRCPHVFGTEHAADAQQASAIWQREKATERQLAAEAMQAGRATAPACASQSDAKGAIEEAEAILASLELGLGGDGEAMPPPAAAQSVRPDVAAA